MIIEEISSLFQPHCSSHFKWKRNFFNFSRTLALKRFFNIHPGNQDQEYHLPPSQKEGMMGH